MLAQRKVARRACGFRPGYFPATLYLRRNPRWPVVYPTQFSRAYMETQSAVLRREPGHLWV